MSNNLLDFWMDDITFCFNSSECANTDCFRHFSNAKMKNDPHAFSELKNTELCKGFVEKTNE